MKVALCQLNYKVGDVEGNGLIIEAEYRRAVADGADIAIFSEMSVCGYPPQDLLDYPHFIERCWKEARRLAGLTGETALVLGCPVFSHLDYGKKLYNAALVMYRGEIRHSFAKTLLPTYNVFDEYRYFEPNSEFRLWEWKGIRIAVTICEDLWDIDDPHYYKISPMAQLMEQGPQMILNLSGSPFSYKHIEARRELMRLNAERYGLPLFYVNQVGANTDLIFDGGSMFIDPGGVIAEELDSFREDYRLISWEPGMSYKSKSHNYHNDDIEQIHDALVLGLRDYFKKSGFTKAIIGLSGGIDSAVVTVLAVEALGRENVLTVMLPSRFSSGHSVSDSEELCRNLGIVPQMIEIHEAVEAFEKLLEPMFGGAPVNIAEENIQARSRGVLLMALSNKFGHILLNTTNKSEAAVGYGTLYGDMCGGIAVLGDVYKTQVYELARYMNRNQRIVPDHILTKAPSAELRPGQKDSDSLPDYGLLDKILHAYIEELKGPEDIIALGFAPDLVRRIIRMVDQNEYKRFQVPPILRVSDKAFGIGRQMPVVGKIN